MAEGEMSFESASIALPLSPAIQSRSTLGLKEPRCSCGSEDSFIAALHSRFPGQDCNIAGLDREASLDPADSRASLRSLELPSREASLCSTSGTPCTRRAGGSMTSQPDFIHDSEDAYERKREVKWEETSPLLGGGPPSSRQGSFLRAAPSTSVLLHESDEELFDRQACFHECKRLLSLAVPVMYSAMLSYGIGLVGVVFVGRLGGLELSVALLAISLHNVTGYAIVAGFSGVLETVCGQAYGARRYRAVGMALQRAVLVSLLLCTLISAMWLFAAEWAILGLGQDPAIAARAAQYLRLTCPALYCESLMSVLSRYLLAQGQAKQPTVSSTIAAVLAPFYNWFFIYHVGLGLVGAAVALSAVQATLLCVLSVLTWRYHASLDGTPRQTWHGWSSAAMRGWSPYAKLGVPSVAMTVVEWSAFEVCVIEAGWLPKPEVSLAVMGLLLNTVTLLYMVPMGIGAGCSTRVSNALGGGLPRAARRSATVGLVLSVGTQLALMTGMYALRSKFIGWLTSAPDVIAAARGPLLITCSALLADGLNAVIAGVLRGSGRQALGASANLVFYWGVAIPVGYALAFHGPHLGVSGLWWGLFTGGYAMLVCGLTVFVTTNWDKQAERVAGEVSSPVLGTAEGDLIIDP